MFRLLTWSTWDWSARLLHLKLHYINPGSPCDSLSRKFQDITCRALFLEFLTSLLATLFLCPAPRKFRFSCSVPERKILPLSSIGYAIFYLPVYKKNNKTLLQGAFSVLDTLILLHIPHYVTSEGCEWQAHRALLRQKEQSAWSALQN